VFVVGYLGDWRRAAAVLFERHSLQGHSAPRREAGQRAAPTISARTEGGGGLGTDFDLDGGVIAFGGNNTSGAIDIAAALNAKSTQRMDFETETLITGALACSGGHAYPGTTAQDAGEGFLLPVAYAIQERAGCENPNAGPDGAGYREGAAYTLEARQTPQAVAFTQNQRDEIRELAVAGALSAEPGMKQQTYVQTSAVRRLTPRECERLQGFPDDYTLISHRGKPAADGPRYKALGNSMAVPVMRWIGERITMVEAA
jgi:DNA (cytosine-5)-methyltransferase 1